MHSQLLVVIVLLLVAPASTVKADDPTNAHSPWRHLLNADLDGWEVFTGIPHKSVDVPGYGKSESDHCRQGKPVGLGDPMKIFQLEMVDGKPVLRVSGLIYAGLSTVESFSNYHLSLEYQWGEKKYPPRLNDLRDSGLLVHCNGAHGAFWNVWMQSLECQIQEGDTGDFIALAGTSVQTRVPLDSKDEGMPIYARNGELVSIGMSKRWGCQHLAGEFEKDGWNLVEVFAVDDRLRFQVNGKVVMDLQDAKIGSQSDGKRLTSGRIQLQSEAAEISYRDIRIRGIQQMP